MDMNNNYVKFTVMNDDEMDDDMDKDFRIMLWMTMIWMKRMMIWVLI